MTFEITQLQEKFAAFRDDPYHRFNVKVRRTRAAELRHLLSQPEAIDVETFNYEVWRFESESQWHGEKINLEAAIVHRSVDEELLQEYERAFDGGEMKVHGNFIWGSGSKKYAPMLPADGAQQIGNIRQALGILNSSDLSPVDKATQIKGIYGFGDNIATGLVMVFHPGLFAIYNNESRLALLKLGLEEGTLSAFEESVHVLKDQLGADDFLELDWFLYNLNREDSLDSQSDEDGNTWRQLVQQVLHEAGGPLPVAEIVKRVTARRSTGKTPERTISATLTTNPQIFQRVSPGVYRLNPTAVVDTNSFNNGSGTTGDNSIVRRVFKVAPGQNAMYWRECRDGAYICIGWDELGDLSQYTTKEQLVEAKREDLEKIYPNASKRSVKVNEIWAFRTLQPGDVVVANKGMAEVLGVGDVVEPGYQWRAERPHMKNTVAVKWRPFAKKTITPQRGWPLVTVAPVSAELYSEIMGEERPSPRSGVWLFQANPQHYDLAETVESVAALLAHGEDVDDEWTVTRYKDEMRSGDIVLMWQGGDEAGIYALGELTGVPVSQPVREHDDLPSWLAANGEVIDTLWTVPFRYTRVLQPPLLKRHPKPNDGANGPVTSAPSLSEHPVLKNLQVLRMPQGTNFKVTTEEWQALQDLLEESRPVRYWWVNQGRNYQKEREEGCIWAPKQTSDGRTLVHHANLTRLRLGDQIIHYANGAIRALSEVVEPAIEAPAVGEKSTYSGVGYLTRLQYEELAQPLLLEALPAEVRSVQTNASDGGPFTRQGSVKQGYLFSASDALFDAVYALTSAGPEPDYVEPTFTDICSFITNAEMRLDEQTLRRYHLALKTRGFVILSGLSGTGKTWLARLYAQAIGAECEVVPVAPNWTANEDLLGFWSPINETYQDTSFSRFLRRAAAEYQKSQVAGRQPRPFHLVLDEMNLARVEYYFAKFLSTLEIRAQDGNATVELGPDEMVSLPPNLFFIGTVNMDETTHGFADKVYDRAQLIEIEASREALSAHVVGLHYEQVVMQIWDAVHNVAPFTFRVLDEIEDYVSEAVNLGVDWQSAFDEQLLHKILPKFRGTDVHIGKALEDLAEISAGQFPLAHRKATIMLQRFRSSGLVSFF